MVMRLLAAQSAGTTEDGVFTRERLLNMYIRPGPDTGATSPALIKQTAGLTDVFDAAASSGVSGPIRAMEQIGSAIFLLQGGGLHRLFLNPTGTVSSFSFVSAGAASKIDTYNSYIAGVDSTVSNVAVLTQNDLSLGDSASTISVSALNEIGTLTYLLGYVIASDSNGDRVARSDLADPSTWGSLNFSEAGFFSDNLVRAFADHTELWLFGESSIEILQFDTSKTAFPFTRIAGGAIESGCLAPRSVAKMGGRVFWLDNNRHVVMGTIGSQPVKISTPAIDRYHESLGALSEISGLLGFTWRESGHEFYGIRSTGNPARIYDLTTGRWHERSSGVNEEEWQVTCTAESQGIWLAGCTDGVLRRFDSSAYQEGSTTVKREIITMPILDGQNNFRLPYFSVKCRTGVIDIGGEAEISMAVSRNGVTWGTEKVKQIGDLGDYDRMVTWRRLGEMRRAEFRLRMTDPIPFSVYGGEWQTA